jgi:hypothetical protein
MRSKKGSRTPVKRSSKLILKPSKVFGQPPVWMTPVSTQDNSVSIATLPSPPMESPPGAPIVIEIAGVGNITSFKNSKMIARGRLITNPKKQKQMEKIIQCIESQLNSIFRITEDEILTGWHPRFAIATSLPLDDSRQWISKLEIYCDEVPVGKEGATITITKL